VIGVVRRVAAAVVARQREIELVVAALAADRHVLIEGPPGTGKSTLLRAVAHEMGVGFQFVEGNAELTPARLVGHFDPARVLADGYRPDVFVDGPLVTALREGALLYVEEINRVPEETLNVLITVMSERELHVPRLGHVVAADGFRLVAAMNPFDAVGTARISSAVYDRVCRLGVGYQPAADEAAIIRRVTGLPDSGWLQQAVTLVRSTRSHPDIRVGSSVRGALDFVTVAHKLAEVRGREVVAPAVGLDAALMALSGRIRVRDGCSRSADEIIAELYAAAFPAEGPEGKARPPEGGADQRDQPPSSAPPSAKEGDEADDAVAQARRRTTSRRQLGRNPTFEQVSPEVGELDEAAVDELMNDDPDAALALLADLAGATDERLRRLARRLAGRLFLEIGRRGAASRRGVGRLVTLPFCVEGDLDVDASIDALAESKASGAAVDAERLRVRAWGKQTTALCLLVDRSGSMGGRPLATSAVAAAAIACRQPEDYSVVAFGVDAVVVKSQDRPKSAERLVGDVLTLRGFGVTDVAGALRVAAEQLGRSTAGRKVVVLLSDCRQTADGDPLAAARLIDELAVIAPSSDCEEATMFARLAGARLATVDGPSQIPAAITEALA
jgi:magnesium chelatase subunit D